MERAVGDVGFSRGKNIAGLGCMTRGLPLREKLRPTVVFRTCRVRKTTWNESSICSARSNFHKANEHED